MKLRTVATLVLIAAVSAVAGACGGELGEDPNAKDQDTRGDDDDEGQAGASGGGGVISTRQLEACKAGFKREDEPGEPCPYITDEGRCYNDSDAACDCVCPREGKGEILCVQYGASADRIEVFCQRL